MSELVLAVEDEPSIGALVRDYLSRYGYRVLWVTSGEEALTELARREVSLVVLDVSLPGMDGFELCRRIEGKVPVIMLTARDEEADRVAGLELGADDYMTKPFSPRELVARVRAVLRRGAPAPDGVLELGPLRISTERREAEIDGRAVELTAREFDLLVHLVRNAGRVVGRGELLSEVWGYLSPGDTRTVEVHVSALRRKLGAPDLIRTVRGIGYRALAP